MIAMFLILIAVGVGIGMVVEAGEQRRLGRMANEVRRRGL